MRPLLTLLIISLCALWIPLSAESRTLTKAKKQMSWNGGCGCGGGQQQTAYQCRPVQRRPQCGSSNGSKYKSYKYLAEHYLQAINLSIVNEVFGIKSEDLSSIPS